MSRNHPMAQDRAVGVENKSDDAGGNLLRVQFELPKLSGCKPLELLLDGKDTIRSTLDEINKSLSLNNNELKYLGALTMERRFKIIIDDKNVIKWDNQTFLISKDTSFIEYFNDFLYESKESAKLKENKMNNDEKEDLNIKYEGSMITRLENNNNELTLGGNDVKISFHRTLRIPDDDKTYPLPPSLGRFELARVQDYQASNGMPDHWKKKKGLILPMWQKEVLFCYC